MKFINDFFLYAGFILISINTLLYLIGYKQNIKTLAYKYFTFYLIVTLIISFWSWYLATKQMNNLHLSHVYFISQFLLLSLFYYSLFNKKQKKYVKIITIITCAALVIQYSIKSDLMYKFNIFEIFITSLPLVTYSIIHLYNSLNHANNYLLINAGILIFITSSTLIFILGNYISSNNLTNSDLKNNIYLINRILYVVYLILILLQWKRNFQLVQNKS